jgi:hypothetical protein
MKFSKRARIKQLASADTARKAKRAKELASPIVQIEGDASPAFKAAMLKALARGTYKRRGPKLGRQGQE